MQDWNAAFPTSPAGEPSTSETPAEPVQIRAQCWLGSEESRPSDLNEHVVNITRTVQDQEHLQMAAELPVRSGVDGNTYSCIFGFKQLLNFKPEISERVEVRGTSAAGVPYVDYYFMTGTNTPQSPIEVRPGNLLDVTELGIDLDAIADNTQTIPQGTDPWNNFPFEPQVTGADSVRRWHPAKYYCSPEKFPNSPGCS